MKKFILSIIMVALLGGGAWAYDFSASSMGNTLYYNITSNTEPYTVEVTYQRVSSASNGYTYYATYPTGSLYIPDRVTYGGITYTVTGIGEHSFIGCSGLTGALTIPNTVTYIGNSAFFGCTGLTSSTGTSTVTIPNSVTSIGNNAFSGCTGLNGTLVIPSSVTSIGYGAFDGCNKLTSVNFNAVNCTHMGDNSIPVFSGCTRLTQITIGENVTNVPEYAFKNCTNLSTVYFNAINCTTMGSLSNPVFSGCNSLSNLFIGANVTRIPTYAFRNCTGISSVTIPNSVTTIGNWAFSNCDGLTRVNYTGNVAGWCAITFQDNPLSYAHNLYINNSLVTDLVIPDIVTEIKSYAFVYATCITSVTIPASVISIDSSAFLWCNELAYVYYTGNIEQWCGITFGDNCSNPVCYSNNLYIDNTLVSNLIIPETVTEIKQFTFCGAECLTAVTIPNTVTSIGDYALKGCTGLTEIAIPNSVMSIGDYAFYGCRGFSEIIIPDSVASIGICAFSNCSGVTGELTIPNSVISIGASAFSGCNGITSVRVGNSVTNIGGNAFSSSELTDIYLYISTPPELSNHICENRYIVTLHVPCGSSGQYSSASYWSAFAANDNIIEFVNYELRVFCNIEEWGTASIIQQASCANRFAKIQATANEGYCFVQWDDGESENPRYIWLNSDKDIMAIFGIAHTITVQSADSEMGTVTGNGVYAENVEVSIEAIPADHYHFVQWTDGNTDNPRTITVVEDTTFTAEFAIDRFTITVESADTAMGAVSEGGTYDYGTEIEISASASEHYHFVQWSDGNTDNPRTITVVEDTTFIAEFAIDRFTLTVESADTAMGTVSEGGTYDYGTEIEISASASEHYHFVQWSDGNTDNPRMITVVEDTTFTAEFAIDQHTITVESADTEMGTVSEGGTYDYGTEIQISASARDGYQFASWNDDNTDNPRYITVTSDATYIASFIPAVGIDESIATEIAIFPNPVTDILNITSSETISEIEIVNVMGQVVKRIEVNSDNVVCNVEDLKAGVYVVRIRTASATFSQRRFVKE